jgi:ankyrin repeat protein
MRAGAALLLGGLGTLTAFGQTTNNFPITLPAQQPMQLQLDRPAKLNAFFDPARPVLGRLLLEACEHGDVPHATSLLDEGAPVNIAAKNGNTPLILAAMHSPALVKVLLGYGADLEARDAWGYTALGAACKMNQTACGQELIDAGADIEVLNKNGHTPLVLAAESGNDDLVQALIAHHANVNRDLDNGSAIWWAIGKDRPREVQMLLAAGADFQPHMTSLPDPKNPPYTALERAAMTGDPAMIDLLLAHGAKITDLDLGGGTPLMAAIKWSNEAMVRYLVGKGDNAAQADHSGMTPLMLAVTNQHEPVWQFLLQHGATIDAKDNEGRTALSHACHINFLPSVQWLVQNGADVNVTDVHGITPLLEAGDRGGIEIVAYLKDKGAHPLDLHILAKPMPAIPLSPAQRWSLAVDALYFQWNGLDPNVLGGGESVRKAKKALLDDWRVTDRPTLEQIVADLRVTGARRRFQLTGANLAALPSWIFWMTTFQQNTTSNETRAIRENYLTWKTRSGLAGDLCRASFVVNEGFVCHYIDENEAWSILLPIAQDTQAGFASWHEMCDNFLDAREMWTGGADPDLDACGDLLCNPKDPNSPWNEIPWTTDLSAH